MAQVVQNVCFFYLIIRYLNQFQRCGERFFPNRTIFQTSIFCLYLRKLVNNFVTHTEKNIPAKFSAIFQVILQIIDSNVKSNLL